MTGYVTSPDAMYYAMNGGGNPYYNPASTSNVGATSAYPSVWGGNGNYITNSYNLRVLSSSYNIKDEAQAQAITQQCEAIAYTIKSGNEDAVMKEYDEFLALLKGQEKFDKCTEQELRAYANSIYTDLCGKSMSEEIEKGCSGSLSTAFKDSFLSIPFVGDDKHSKDDLISEITGTPKPRGADAEKALGYTAGVLSTAGVGAGVGFLVGGPVGAAIGAGVGAVVGILRSIF